MEAIWGWFRLDDAHMVSPSAEWLRHKLGAHVEGLLLGKHSRIRDYVDLHHLETRLREHRAGLADHSFAVMMLVGLEVFHRVFLEGPSLEKPTATLPDWARAGRAGLQL